LRVTVALQISRLQAIYKVSLYALKAHGMQEKPRIKVLLACRVKLNVSTPYRAGSLILIQLKLSQLEKSVGAIPNCVTGQIVLMFAHDYSKYS